MNTKKNFLYISNWKMSLSLNEALSFASNYYDEILSLADRENTQMVIAPSAEALFPIAQAIKETSVALSAQCCAEHERGSFTGQISPRSLYELGCSYCIIGHSERRSFNNESDQSVAKQAQTLFDNNIIPIACIGEDKNAYDQGETLSRIEEQLAPIAQAAQSSSHQNTPLCIAYEPVWAIGAQKAADNDHIESVLAWIESYLNELALTRSYRLVYGGSITSHNAARLKSIPQISGFLIGRASLDFQELEKIVHYR